MLLSENKTHTTMNTSYFYIFTKQNINKIFLDRFPDEHEKCTEAKVSFLLYKTTLCIQMVLLTILSTGQQVAFKNYWKTEH